MGSRSCQGGFPCAFVFGSARKEAFMPIFPSLSARLSAMALVVLLLVSLFSGALCTSDAADYRTLEKGMSGEDVRALKLAMYWLGYFTSQNVSDDYNDVMVKRVKLLQERNGLTADGVASPELQAMVFAGQALPAENAPAPSPVPTAIPTAAPAQTPAPLPEGAPLLTEDGFLSPDADLAEYVYENETEGRWIYLSADLAIYVDRREDKASRNTWFECDVRCTPASPLRNYVHLNQYGKIGTGQNPLAISRENRFVLGLSDDHFGTRAHGKSTVGVIVRNGQILYDKTYQANRSAFPNLETLALFGDGSMKTFLSNACTGQEYLDMGATDVYAFGPILVQNGQLGPHMTEKNYYHYREPRMALGMIAPYHYFILAVNGRTDDCAGVYLNWLAEKMLEHGVQEGINLDGGGTACLTFMGKRLNRTGSSTRALHSMIGFGSSDLIDRP